MEEAGEVWKHAVTIVLYLVITSKVTEVLSLSKSQELILQDVIPFLAALRTFYQRLNITTAIMYSDIKLS
jgi:hypothetical protein